MLLRHWRERNRNLKLDSPVTFIWTGGEKENCRSICHTVFPHTQNLSLSRTYRPTVCDKRHIEHTLKRQAGCHRSHKHITSGHMSCHGACCRDTPLKGFAANWQFSIVPSLLCHCHSSCHHGDERSFPASHAVAHTLHQRQTLSHLSIRLSSKHTKSRKALLLFEST